MRYLSDDGGKTYNLCHCEYCPFPASHLTPPSPIPPSNPLPVWSNFEIADMDFWRSPAYQAYFAFLESRGGFYYERWGDAPVHSIAAALFATKDQVHFFRDVNASSGGRSTMMKPFAPASLAS